MARVFQFRGQSAQRLELSLRLAPLVCGQRLRNVRKLSQLCCQAGGQTGFGGQSGRQSLRVERRCGIVLQSPHAASVLPTLRQPVCRLCSECHPFFLGLLQAAPGLLRLNCPSSRSLSPAEQRSNLSVNLAHQVCGHRDPLRSSCRQLQGQRLQHCCGFFDTVCVAEQFGNPLDATVQCRAGFVGPDRGQPGGSFMQAVLNALAAVVQCRQLPKYRIQSHATFRFYPLLRGNQTVGGVVKRLGLSLGEVALLRSQRARLLGKLAQFSARYSGGFSSAGQFKLQCFASQQQHRVKQHGLGRQLPLLGADQQSICCA